MCTFTRAKFSSVDKYIAAFVKTCPFLLLPRCTHQENEFTRQVDVFSAIVIFNVLPCLIEYQFCVFYLGGSKVYRLDVIISNMASALYLFTSWIHGFLDLTLEKTSLLYNIQLVLMCRLVAMTKIVLVGSGTAAKRFNEEVVYNAVLLDNIGVDLAIERRVF